MNLDTTLSGEYVEYVIIGTHATVWIALLLSWLFNVSVSRLADVNFVLLLLLLPFIYVVGILVDSVSQTLLQPVRRRIRLRVFGLARRAAAPQDMSRFDDELLAFRSPTLYAAYEWRMRRTKVVGAAIPNWLALGSIVVLHLGTPISYAALVVEISAAAFTVVSAFAWADLTSRAYAFRKKAATLLQSQPSPQS